MKFNHHNVTGIAPPIAELVRFVFERDHRVEFCRGALPDTATAIVHAYTPNRENALLTALIASGWAFMHQPMTERRAEFHILVTME